MTTILLVLDTSDQVNWGCQATTSALKYLLAEAFPSLNLLSIKMNDIRREYRRFETPLLRGRLFESKLRWLYKQRSSSPLGMASEGTKFVLSREAQFYPRVTDEFDEVAEKWLQGEGGPVGIDFVEKAGQSDAIVFNGEGAIYDNILKGIRPLFMMYVARKYLNKPSFIINHTAHMHSSVPIMLSMARTVYPLMDGVTVREPASQRNLVQMGIHVPAEIVPDALFGLEFPTPELVTSNFAVEHRLENYVCITGSSLMSEPAGWSAKEGYAMLIDGLRHLGVMPVIAARDSSDMFLEKLAREMNVPFFGPPHTFRDLYDLLAGARLFISGRYHPIIISALTSCPFVPLNANSHKIEGLCELLNYPMIETFDSYNIRKEVPHILEASKQILAHRDEYTLRLRHRVAELRTQASRQIQIVADCLTLR